MPFVTFTRHLNRFFPSLTANQVEGATIRELIDALDRLHPGLASYLIDETGRLRRHVNVFIGEEPVRDRDRLSDPVAVDDRVYVLQALSGG